MKTVQAVYLLTDLEGVAGIDDWDPRNADYAAQAKGVAERAEMRRLLTGEVNAAAQGLFNAGVKEVVINDHHGEGRNLLVDALVSGVKIVRGTNEPSALKGIARRFDVMAQVGMHAMTGTPNACLAHTMCRGRIFRVNGRAVGEMEIAAILAGQIGIPWVFVSGDNAACREAEEWVPGIITAAVKESLSNQCAIHLAPIDARRLIREQICKAMTKVDTIAPLAINGTVTLEIECVKPWPAEPRPGAECINDFTIRYTGPHLWQVYNHFIYGKSDVPLPQ